MTDSLPPLRFSGTIQIQFVAFLQSLMQTAPDGAQAFVGRVQGFFGTPPNGTRFEAQVKLTVGAGFQDDAYEVFVHPALAQLGAHPTLRQAALEYVHQSMSFMVGDNWRELSGLTATNNVIQTPGPLVAVTFEEGGVTW